MSRADRIIPARAGKTTSGIKLLLAIADHPRAGGENLVDNASQVLHPGSSPRGRGKPDLGGKIAHVRRIIPARAGKTLNGRSGALPCWDHPRAGGENRSGGAARPRHRGSSPRGRGKPDEHMRVAMQERIIPARAGKTVAMSLWFFLTWDHPRAGGENLGCTLQGVQ